MASCIICVASRSHISGSQEVAHPSCSNAAAHHARSKLTQVHGPQMTQGPNLMRQIQSANPMRHDGVLHIQLFSGKSTNQTIQLSVEKSTSSMLHACKGRMLQGFFNECKILVSKSTVQQKHEILSLPSYLHKIPYEFRADRYNIQFFLVSQYGFEVLKLKAG